MASRVGQYGINGNLRTCCRLLPSRSLSRTFTSSRQQAAKQVRIVEVGPRDGLQNEKTSIPVATKIELVERLAKTGLQTIEAGSFVSPKWVPQMANSSEILEHILQRPPSSPKSITYQWLLPNVRGLDNYFGVQNSHTGGSQPYPTPPATPTSDGSSSMFADDSPALDGSSSHSTTTPSNVSSDGTSASSEVTSTTSQHEISIFLAATESFSKKNTNCTIAESLDRFHPLIKQALANNTRVRAYISVALGCPFEGPDVDPHKVAELAAALLEMGADEISVADTTGMGTAPRTLELLRTLSAAGIRNEDLAFHFHDTFGQALVNTVVALEHGIRTFDSAVGGLGGCPFSPGATGNVATEDLVHCLHSLGADTGVDIREIAAIGDWISKELGKPNESRAGKATLAKMRA